MCRCLNFVNYKEKSVQGRLDKVLLGVMTSDIIWDIVVNLGHLLETSQKKRSFTYKFLMKAMKTISTWGHGINTSSDKFPSIEKLLMVLQR